MKNPLLLDEADKRGEQHFYSRSSSCRKSFITFSRAMKEKKYPSTCINSPSNHFFMGFTITLIKNIYILYLSFRKRISWYTLAVQFKQFRVIF